MNERTRVIRLKVQRAKHHIVDLDKRIQNFFTGSPNPYPIVKERDPDTGDLVFSLGKCSPIPEDFPLVIGDVLQNLRSALDHLAWQLILSNGCSPKSRSGFPIAKNAKEYKTESSRRVKGMSPQAITLIDSLKPYGGGNEALFGLHTLNNTDKHRLVLVVGGVHVSTSLKLPLSRTPKEFRLALPSPLESSYPLKDGTELYRIFKDDFLDFEQDPQFSFRIAFGDAEAMTDEPLLPPLNQLADFIDDIILRFDGFLK